MTNKKAMPLSTAKDKEMLNLFQWYAAMRRRAYQQGLDIEPLTLPEAESFAKSYQGFR